MKKQLHRNTIICNVLIIVVSCILLCITMSSFSFAHSGGTDSEGGHYDHSTGEYHYHHGYPAHQHPDGICPYENEEPYYESSESYSDSSYNDDDYDEDYENSYTNTAAATKVTSEEHIWKYVAGIIGIYIVSKMLFKGNTTNSQSTNSEASATAQTTVNYTSKKKSNSYNTSNGYYCPRCGARMVRRTGRYGSFYGCTNYPRCRGTRSIKY